MTSRRQIIRRWMRWSRYIDRCAAFGEHVAATRGCERAYNRWARAYNRHRSVS